MSGVPTHNQKSAQCPYKNHPITTCLLNPFLEPEVLDPRRPRILKRVGHDQEQNETHIAVLGGNSVVPFRFAANSALAVAAPVEYGLNEIKSNWVT